MTKETLTLPPREVLKTRIGEKGIITLEDTSEGLIRKEKASLWIKDHTLIEPVLEDIKRQIAQWEKEAKKETPINLVVIDFRDINCRKGLEKLTETIGDPKSFSEAISKFDELNVTNERKLSIENARTHQENSRLILIDPLAGHDEEGSYDGLNRIGLYAKYGMGILAIVPKRDMRFNQYPNAVFNFLGGDLDYSHHLDFDPHEDKT